MSIRPIDMQVMINTTDQVTKINNENNNRGYFVQHHINKETSQGIKQEQSTIPTCHKTIYNTVQREGQGNKNRKDKKKQPENKGCKNRRVKSGTGHIDIKI
jgi:hypothetical protein